MIRFGEILPLWNFLRVLDNFVLSNGAFGKILNILWQIFHAIGKINIFDNGQLLNIFRRILVKTVFEKKCFIFVSKETNERERERESIN